MKKYSILALILAIAITLIINLTPLYHQYANPQYNRIITYYEKTTDTSYYYSTHKKTTIESYERYNKYPLYQKDFNPTFSYWRYKEPYKKYNYPYEDYYHEYYYKPRYDFYSNFYNWRF